MTADIYGSLEVMIAVMAPFPSTDRTSLRAFSIAAGFVTNRYIKKESRPDVVS